MTPLEAARKLLDDSPTLYIEQDGFICPFCLVATGRSEGDHTADCPWLAMPKIVAALEAAELLTTKMVFGGKCLICGAWRADGSPHESWCMWQALVAALKDAPA